jgi:hypothetical protein
MLETRLDDIRDNTRDSSPSALQNRFETTNDDDKLSHGAQTPVKSVHFPPSQ